MQGKDPTEYFVSYLVFTALFMCCRRFFESFLYWAVDILLLPL